MRGGGDRGKGADPALDQGEGRRRALSVVAQLAVAAVVGAFTGQVCGASLAEFEHRDYMFAALLGAAVGIAELVSRYKDRPTNALATSAAWLYVTLNSLASASALGLIRVIESRVAGAEGGAGAMQPWSEVLLAGTGSMAFFRSAVFNFRYGEAQIPVGPQAFVEVILQAADRQVDRDMAMQREKAVEALVAAQDAAASGPLDYMCVKNNLPSYCFALLQSVTLEDRKRLLDRVDAIDRQADLAAQTRVRLILLALMGVVGPEVLGRAVESLKDVLRAEGAETETEALLSQLDFKTIEMALVVRCAKLANRSPIEQRVLDLVQRIGVIREDRLSDEDKLRRMSGAMLEEFSVSVITEAVRAVQREQAAAPPAAAQPATAQLPPPSDDGVAELATALEALPIEGLDKSLLRAALEAAELEREGRDTLEAELRSLVGGDGPESERRESLVARVVEVTGPAAVRTAVEAMTASG